jgi:hypothetical protein
MHPTVAQAVAVASMVSVPGKSLFYLLQHRSPLYHYRGTKKKLNPSTMDRSYLIGNYSKICLSIGTLFVEPRWRKEAVDV